MQHHAGDKPFATLETRPAPGLVCLEDTRKPVQGRIAGTDQFRRRLAGQAWPLAASSHRQKRWKWTLVHAPPPQVSKPRGLLPS